MQKTVLLLVILFFSNSFYSQVNETITQRKGIVFGLGLGAGVLSLNTNDTLSVTFSTTLPNIKFGYMFTERFAMYTLLPGANYKYKNKARGFEGILVAGQYWITNKWWVLAGTGLTFDAPAFYTVKDPKTAEFYTGFPAFTFATGFEVLKKEHFVVDLHYRIFLGESHIQNEGERTGVSNMFILGFNWY